MRVLLLCPYLSQPQLPRLLSSFSYFSQGQNKALAHRWGWFSEHSPC